AALADQQTGVRLDGIMLYSGHVTGNVDEQAHSFKASAVVTRELIDRMDQKGLCRDIISSGSTPSAFQTHLLEIVTEFRPGTYVYNDLNIVRGRYCSLENCAAKIYSTVVSNAVSGQIVLDAGTKTLTSDLCGPAPDSGFGLIVEYPDARIDKLTEEHAQVDITECSDTPRIGDVVTVIPNHICPCVNLQNNFWLKREDNLESHVVDTRGCVV
ncbi:MAG: hypothetical protein KDB27_34780, partial [Planctomycetales bacterium]|nr:hypothetical protein [Planctomycetales bacterium]